MAPNTPKITSQKPEILNVSNWISILWYAYYVSEYMCIIRLIDFLEKKNDMGYDTDAWYFWRYKRENCVESVLSSENIFLSYVCVRCLQSLGCDRYFIGVVFVIRFTSRHVRVIIDADRLSFRTLASGSEMAWEFFLCPFLDSPPFAIYIKTCADG